MKRVREVGCEEKREKKKRKRGNLKVGQRGRGREVDATTSQS